MKSTYLFAVFAGALIACSALRATADELDDLLYGEPSAGQQPVAPLAIEPKSPLGLGPIEHGLIEPGASSYDDPSHWRPTVAAPPARVSINKTPAGARQAANNGKTAETLPPSPVPEPSAVILGGLALLYFLIFGRRRRIA